MSLFEVQYAQQRNMNKYGIYDLDRIDHNDVRERERDYRQLLRFDLTFLKTFFF